MYVCMYVCMYGVVFGCVIASEFARQVEGAGQERSGAGGDGRVHTGAARHPAGKRGGAIFVCMYVCKHAYMYVCMYVWK